jgi:DNA transposition AAA+ family ATPase
MIEVTSKAGDYSAEEMDMVRAEITRIVEDEKIGLPDVAKLMGMPYGTLHGWYRRTYQGNNVDKTRKVLVWLEGRREQEKTRQAIPELPGFLKTPSSEAFINVFRLAQALGDIGVISGGAGVGKSMAAEEYAARNSNVWLSVMEPALRSVQGALSEIALAMRIEERDRSRLGRMIVDRVRGTGGLIIVDEAQHLDTLTLDQLRMIPEKSGGGCGIVLIGNERVRTRLEGGQRNPDYAQIFSRLGASEQLARPKDEDIGVLLAAWQIDGSDECKFLRGVARKPGALRVMSKTIRLASMIAAGTDEHVDLRHLRAAYDRLSGAQGKIREASNA